MIADLSILVFSILIAVSFVAGFINSIAGGGGLLVAPSLLLAGVSPITTLGTSKLIGGTGNAVSVFNYGREGHVDWKIALIGIGFSFFGVFLGAKLILSFDEQTVGRIIVFMFPLAILAMFIPKKSNAEEKGLKKTDYFLKVPLVCLYMGVYDGFFGPGTGTYLAISFFMFLPISLLKATANTKVFNAFTNLVAFGVYAFSGNVNFMLAIPLSISNMIGSYFGSKLALKKGHGLIKWFIMSVIAVMFVFLIIKFYVVES